MAAEITLRRLFFCPTLRVQALDREDILISNFGQVL